MSVPPFERFYEEQQGPVLAQLRGMLGRDAADDAFQETFLRALRAYPTLEHGRHLRAWALQIARNVAIDMLRRTRATSADVPDLESVDEPLPYEELRRLTAGPAREGARGSLPPLRLRPQLRGHRHRARLVVGRGAPGRFVRRPPPPQKGALMTVSPELDRRFRDAAAAEGLLDVAYELHDTPVGELLVAVTDRGVCEIHYDADPDAEAERLARIFGTRVLRSPRPTDEVRRQLDEYFAGERQEFELDVDLGPAREFGRAVLEQLARVPYGELTTYGTLAERAGRPRAARAVGTIMNRNPVPIVLPCHRVVGSTGSLVGYAGGLDRKRTLLQLEGALLNA